MTVSIFDARQAWLGARGHARESVEGLPLPAKIEHAGGQRRIDGWPVEAVVVVQARRRIELIDRPSTR